MPLEFDFDQVKSNLLTIQKNVRKNVIDKSLEEGAKIILEEEMRNVPVYTPNKKNKRKGGKLKSSLGISKKTGTDFKRKVHVGIQNAHEREVVYGYYQEHGYSRGGKAIAGKKWMKKSFNKSIKKADEKIKETVVKEITSGIKSR